VKTSSPKLRAALVAAAFLALASAASAEALIKSELVAEKVVQHASGQTSTAPATAAKPGDLVVYTARYSNTGKDAARSVVVTVPVPAGLDYQGRPANDKLPPSLASLDGQNFAAIPLTRKVRTPDGKELVQPVPLGEYRFLRWNLSELAAGATVSVQLTAKVSTNP
jgi:uncharacterized repeat protein (TIGR01451 family)